MSEFPSSKLDLFSTPSQEGSVSCQRYQTFNPITVLPTLINEGSVDFFCESSSVEYTSLANSYLEMDISVIKLENGEEKKLGLGEKVSMAPGLIFAVFRSIDVFVNDSVVSSTADFLYNVSSVVRSLLFLNKRTLKNRFSAGQLNFSTPGKQGNLDPDVPDADPELRKRNFLTSLSMRSYLVGPLTFSLALCDRLLPKNTELRFRFNLANAEATLNCPTPAEGSIPAYRIKLHSFKLHISRMRLFSSPDTTLSTRLRSAAPAYPQCVPKSFVVNLDRGTTSKSVSLVQNGLQLPRTVIVVMYDRDSFSRFDKPKFYFEDFSLKNAFVQLDDQILPYGMSYNQDSFMRLAPNYYLSQLALGFSNDDRLFSQRGFEDGYFMMVFPVEPLPSLGSRSTVKRERESGQLSLHLSFQKELEKPVSVFVMSIYNEIMHLTSSGPKFAVF